MANQQPLSLGSKKKVTKAHKPILWETMLGAVSAMNLDGEVKYFDYDYEGAITWATTGRKDFRTWKVPHGVRYTANSWDGPRVGRLALWGVAE